VTDPNDLLDGLARIQEQGRDSFLIVSVGEDHFAQFVAPGTGLLAEVVGNAFLPPGRRLTFDQQAEMRRRGWSGDGEQNWSRTYPVSLALDDRQRVLHDALDVLDEVYGATGDIAIDDLWLEGPEEAPVESLDPSPQGRRMVAVLIAVSLAALGAALAMFFAA